MAFGLFPFPLHILTMGDKRPQLRCRNVVAALFALVASALSAHLAFKTIGAFYMGFFLGRHHQVYPWHIVTAGLILSSW